MSLLLYKRIFLTILLFVLVENVFTQNKQGFSLKPPSYTVMDKMEIVDMGYLRISYAFNADNINDINTYIDLQCLEIGNKLSKYYSSFIATSDSLCYNWRKEHPHAQNVPRWIGDSGKRKNRWSEYQYSEIFKTDKDLTVYSRMPMYLNNYDCWHKEEYPLQQWEISSDTLSVCGYLCQRALCRFRGRDFVAWFTPDIPVNNGPWKFGGLPGLILKISDKDKIYVFECIGIEHFKIPIKKNDYSKYKIVERRKLLELQQKINENYPKMIRARDPKTKQPVSCFTPYEPLELE